VKNLGSLLLLPPAAEALAADSFCFSYGKEFFLLVNRFDTIHLAGRIKTSVSDLES
jgi:hypothetical protein